MANEVGRLFVSLGLNSSDFHKKLTAAEKATERQAKSMQREFMNIVKPIEQAFAMVTAAALASSAAIGIMVKKTAEYADNMDDASKRTGIAAERLQTLNYAAKITGTSMEGLEKGLKILSNNMLDASRNTGTAKITFNELGIAVKNTDGTLRKTTDVLAEAADKISKMKDDTRQAAYANDLFGKSGTMLLPLLKMGASGIAELEGNLKKYGYVMSSKEIAAGETFNDNLLTMQMAIEGLGMRFSSKLIPVLDETLNKMLDWVASNKELINQKMDDVIGKIGQGFKLIADNKEGIITVFQAVAFASEKIMQSVSGWMMILGGLTKAGRTLSNTSNSLSIGGRVGYQYTPKATGNSANSMGNYPAASSALSNFQPWMLGWDNNTNTWISGNTGSSGVGLGGKGKYPNAFAFSGSANAQSYDVGNPRYDKFNPSGSLGFNTDFTGLRNLFDSFNEKSSEFSSNIEEHEKKVKIMQDRWTAFGDTMSNVLANSVMQSGNAFKNIADGFTRMLETMALQFASKAALFGILNLFTGGTFGAGKSVLDFAFGGFRADGGSVNAGESVVVGERGAELFTPKTAGYITPSNKISNSTLTVNFNGSEINAMSKMSLIQLAEKINAAARDGLLKLTPQAAY